MMRSCKEKEEEEEEEEEEWGGRVTMIKQCTQLSSYYFQQAAPTSCSTSTQ